MKMLVKLFSGIYIKYISRNRCIVNYLVILLGVYALTACNDRIHEFILLHTNDSHGNIVAVDSQGGMSERAAFIRAVREKGFGTLLVDAGDINTGQAVSNMFDAKPDFEAYNYMGYDAVTLGNHEFDKPVPVLLRQMEWADFPVLTSNVTYRGKVLGKEFLIKDIDGIKVGLFGLTTQNTEQISIYAKGVIFKDEIETARKMVQQLKEQQVEIIIGLVHLGFTETTPDFTTSLKLAAKVDGIDILVDGHSHSYISEPIKINNTWIVTANQSGRYVGEGKVAVKNGKLIDFTWKPVQIKGFKPDTILAKSLSPYIQAAAKDLETVIGEASGNFVLFENGKNMARYQEVALGDMITDALKWKAGQLHLKVDFALINSGGIREGLSMGKITKGEILGVLPFANELDIVALKGKEVKRLFDFIATIPLGNGAFAQVSKEVKVSYNETSKQVESLTIGNRPIEEEKVYYMATCDYVASGKDGYHAGLGELISLEKTSQLLSNVVMEYIRSKGTINPQIEQRIEFLR